MPATRRSRARRLRRQIEESSSDSAREKLQERLAKTVGGVAIIKVGAATETEMKEKKARVEDALHAIRAAMTRGSCGAVVSRCCKLIALQSLKVTTVCA